MAKALLKNGKLWGVPNTQVHFQGIHFHMVDRQKNLRHAIKSACPQCLLGVI